ncbi:uncharacterized protein LOC126585669 isoform X6 [Malus sylvestris]|uniref:uncharacterized protein LOC126585669 isoform X6 n=1 Tax=Malus sylvestris TaxID=3752 RepID=UPI0021AC0E6B|nr:uncharacterized protein LOC126585669 isoform X6 [Malus sylvestris]
MFNQRSSSTRHLNHNAQNCRPRWTNRLRPDLKRGLLSEYEEKTCRMKRFGWKMRRRSLYPWKHAFRKAHIHLCLANRAWRARPQMVYAYTSMNKVVNPAGWRNNNHPERDNNVAYGEYKCMGPGSSTYHKRNLSKELTDEQVKPFISSGYIQGHDQSDLLLWIIPLLRRSCISALQKSITS